MGSILGNRVVRVEDPRFLTGEGTYVENMDLPNGTWVQFVRSQYAHGSIVSIDVSDALDVPGVIAIYTGAEIDLPVFPHGMPTLPDGCQRPLIAHDRVRFVGEPVAAVIAENRYAAADAVDLVIVDIDPLPAIVELDDALADETLIHPAVGSNVYLRFASEKQADFDGCEVIGAERPCAVSRRSVRDRRPPSS